MNSRCLRRLLESTRLRLAGFDFVGDAVVLSVADQVPLDQFVGTCVRLAGYDAARLGGGNAGQRFELISGRLVDVQNTLGLEAVNDAFDGRLCVSGRFRCGLGCVVPDSVRAALGRGSRQRP